MQHLRKYGARARFICAAPTIADSREVCAEGDSGIITLYRDEFTIGGQLRYNRSLGEAWHRDGGYVKFMGAEEPERFNGPQWTGGWCLAGDTPVLMAGGSEKPISEVRFGDFVLTRTGPRRVLASVLTKREAKVLRLTLADGRNIVSTPEHPVFVTRRGFVEAGQLVSGDSVLSADPALRFFAGTVASVEELPTPVDVYDLHVEDAHEFFAAGILVHNCDELYAWQREAWEQLQFAVRLELPDDYPRIIVTTTPKGSKLVREVEGDETTAMTHGRMQDNPHLSERRRQKLYRMFGKTRLGKAELEGEYYEGVEGALWQTEMFRYRHFTEELLHRMVEVGVGVDPATTSGKRSNETGICCAGRDGHRDSLGRLWPNFYIFHLEAYKLPPLGWAEKTNDVYEEYGANYVVGETNNGGDLVETNVHSVNPRIPFVKVTASRGKYTRAEEAALLYDQGRVYHVGHHERAEERMCSFLSSDDNDGDDEVDALTWILKKLNVYDQPPEAPQIVGRREEVESYKVY